MSTVPHFLDLRGELTGSTFQGTLSPDNMAMFLVTKSGHRELGRELTASPTIPSGCHRDESSHLDGTCTSAGSGQVLSQWQLLLTTASLRPLPFPSAFCPKSFSSVPPVGFTPSRFPGSPLVFHRCHNRPRMDKMCCREPCTYSFTRKGKFLLFLSHMQRKKQ